ncbi:tRNA guanine-1-methyltransferase [Nitzschia inconspicua]|uniref:tRNA (guanine(9)-N(1))-methyltransferase n=1 Tax=Nitzschia inconspicua TaxID=303405 RepID=A0A9K3M5P4_9STRA|nr:tRNA guanine-1-methyltransferase [Nitzschia inconspicua]
MSVEGGGNEQCFDTEKKSDGMDEPAVHVPSVMSSESTTQDEDPSTANKNNSTASPSQAGEIAPKMSKNQLKRKRKLEKLMEQKRQKKEQQKCLKSAKAKAEGRDIEAERRDMEQRRLSGEGWTKRQEKWRENFETQGGEFQVCLDCSFEDQMTYKELNSLASQIRYCYATNRRAKHPVRVTVTSLRGKTQEILQNVAGLDRWEHREFYQTDKDVLSAYSDKARLVYLTSDSTNILQTLEEDKIYIIGGIVDRNRLKRATIDRAESLGIATAKLPISDHLDITATKVLTCNHVFDILVKWKECNKDWKKTLLEVLPNRKDAKEKS